MGRAAPAHRPRPQGGRTICGLCPGPVRPSAAGGLSGSVPNTRRGLHPGGFRGHGRPWCGQEHGGGAEGADARPRGQICAGFRSGQEGQERDVGQGGCAFLGLSQGEAGEGRRWSGPRPAAHMRPPWGSARGLSLCLPGREGSYFLPYDNEAPMHVYSGPSTWQRPERGPPSPVAETTRGHGLAGQGPVCPPGPPPVLAGV